MHESVNQTLVYQFSNLPIIPEFFLLRHIYICINKTVAFKYHQVEKYRIFDKFQFRWETKIMSSSFYLVHRRNAVVGTPGKLTSLNYRITPCCQLQNKDAIKWSTKFSATLALYPQIVRGLNSSHKAFVSWSRELQPTSRKKGLLLP